MNYVSTRNRNIALTASQAISQGLARDGGLLTPEVLPKLTPEMLEDLRGKSYSQRAVAVMKLFLEDFSEEELTAYTQAGYGAGKFDDPQVGLHLAFTGAVRDEILDEFLGFIQDEDHSILISSHITSDLEKVADYITYLHQGKVVLSAAKDVLQDQYGRVGCTAQQLSAVDPTDLVRVRKGSYGCEALVSDRAAFHKKYPQLMVEPISLEDIMLLIGKGEPL